MNHVKVGDISVQIRGVSYKKSDVRTEPADGYTALLRGGNIGAHGLILEDLQYVPTKAVSEKQILRAGDVVLVASSGSLDVVGKATAINETFSGTFGAFCKVLRPLPNVDHRYFAHYFKTPHYRHIISSLAAGANINNLKNEHLTELKLPFPSLIQQHRIADILDKADALRTNRREAIAQLEALSQSIFHEMFGLPSRNGHNWPIKAIGDLLESAQYGTSEKSESSGTVPVLRMGNLTYQGHLDLTNLKYLVAGSAQTGKYILRQGDVLSNRTNSADLVGKTALFNEEGTFAFAGYLIRLRCGADLNPQYLTTFMNVPDTKAKLRAMCKSIVGMANINAKEIQAMSIMVPPIHLQHEFANRVAAIERLKITHRIQLDELDNLFRSLQDRAFKGEL